MNKTIAKLNDEFRHNIPFTNLGKFIMTRGVADLPPKKKLRLFQRIVRFNNFNEDNDPYEEHDFGTITLDKRKYLWKINYYDKSMKYSSEDPSNPEITTRVMTVMLAEEY